LHQRLVRAANSERVSLNQLVTSMLSERISLR
jgi:predicted HicB family RNase H-like nuclease